MKPGWNWWSQTWGLPETHCGQAPQPFTNGSVTRSPGFQRRHALADGFDLPGQFVPRHVRQNDIGVMAHPAVPVAEAEPGRPDADDHPILSRLRV